MRRSIISLFGQICLGLFFSKSQCFSSTDIPSETYLCLDDLAMRSIKGKVPSFIRFDLKQIADTVAFMVIFGLHIGLPVCSKPPRNHVKYKHKKRPVFLQVVDFWRYGRDSNSVLSNWFNMCLLYPILTNHVTN